MSQNKVTCQVPSQVYSNGLCFNKCPSNYSSYNALCLQNCPTGFTDLGHTCSPPNVLRETIKTALEPCKPTEIDRQGNCFEPQLTTLVTVNGAVQPRVVGCGCIRKSFSERLQCPAGFVKFNNGCVTKCPQGYFDIVDASGEISSMYCAAKCPLKTGSQERWTSIGNQCVKEYISNSNVVKSSVSNSVSNGYARNTTVLFGLPNTVLSYLASRPLGSSLNDRVRVGQSVGNSVSQSGAGSWASQASTWIGLLSDPFAIFVIIGGLFLLFYLGPVFLPLLGKAAGNLLNAATSVTSEVAEAGSKVVSGALKIASSAEGAASSGINAFSANTNARAANTNASAANTNASAANTNASAANTNVSAASTDVSAANAELVAANISQTAANTASAAAQSLQAVLAGQGSKIFNDSQ